MFLLSAISCRHGYLAKGGAKGVGLATTRAVVESCVAILIVNNLRDMETDAADAGERGGGWHFTHVGKADACKATAIRNCAFIFGMSRCGLSAWSVTRPPP